MTPLGPEAAPYVVELIEHLRGEALNIGAPTAGVAVISRDRSTHGG